MYENILQISILISISNSEHYVYIEQVLFVNLFNFHLTLYIFCKIGSFIIL